MRSNCAEDLASRGRILSAREMWIKARPHKHSERWRQTEAQFRDSHGSLGETHRGTWERLTGKFGRESQRTLGETHRGAWERLTGVLGRD